MYGTVTDFKQLFDWLGNKQSDNGIRIVMVKGDVEFNGNGRKMSETNSFSVQWSRRQREATRQKKTAAQIDWVP